MGKMYRTSVYVPMPDGSGKRKTVRAESQKELNKKVLELKASIIRGELLYSAAYFADWRERWFEDTKVPLELSQRTLEEYRRAITHLKRRFGGKTQIKDIRLAEFQSFINELAVCNPNTGAPASRKLIKDLIRVGNGIFKYAAANGVSGIINFFDAVMIPKQATVTKRRRLSEDEQSMILDSEHSVKLPAMIMMFSGLRLGEVLALEWNDVDFDTSTITVNKSMVFEENKGKITSGGKTRNATRIVAIPPVLVEYLKQEKDKSKTDLICVTANRKPHTKSSWRRSWDSYIIDLNLKYGYDNKFNKNNPRIKASQLPLRIERFTAHYLRHTYATLLYLQGVDVVTAKQMMGHADVSTTINIYTDLANFNRKSLSDDYKQKLKNQYKIDYSL